jgi:hypothetical protein
MTLEDFILSTDVQAWLNDNGYGNMGIYPTGEPFVEIDGSVYLFDVTPEEFQQLLQDSVDQDQDFITPHRIEDEQDEDSLVIPVI